LPSLLEARLAAALRQALPDRTVIGWSAAIAGQTPAELGINLRQLAPRLGDQVTMQVDWLLKAHDGASWRGQWRGSEALADSSYASLVDATGRLTDSLARQLAEQLKPLPACNQP
jgi:uncharacterized lipoprotein YmbA